MYHKRWCFIYISKWPGFIEWCFPYYFIPYMIHIKIWSIFWSRLCIRSTMVKLLSIHLQYFQSSPVYRPDKNNGRQQISWSYGLCQYSLVESWKRFIKIYCTINSSSKLKKKNTCQIFNNQIQNWCYDLYFFTNTTFLLNEMQQKF